MEGYKIQIKPSAVKELEALPNKDLSRVVRRIQGLADNPRPPGCEKLSGEEKYRIRKGSYRVVYAISDDERTVVVVKVGHRREVYR